MTDKPEQDPKATTPACPTQSGVVLFLGVPNAGKSSLLNAVLGVKLAAVSHKPNMTRFCITGVHTEGTAQMILMDAPGLMQSPQNLLEKTIQTHLKQTLTTVDVVVAVVDVATAFHDREQHVYTLLARETKPVLLVLNKIDTVKNRCTGCPKTRERVCRAPSPMVFSVCPLCPSKMRR